MQQPRDTGSLCIWYNTPDCPKHPNIYYHVGCCQCAALGLGILWFLTAQFWAALLPMTAVVAKRVLLHPSSSWLVLKATQRMGLLISSHGSTTHGSTSNLAGTEARASMTQRSWLGQLSAPACHLGMPSHPVQKATKLASLWVVWGWCWPIGHPALMVMVSLPVMKSLPG